jgi:hypothetical protein
MIYESPNLPARGANRQCAGGFEDDRWRVEEGLEEGPKPAQHLFTTVPRRSLLELYRTRPPAGFLESHTAARHNGIDQDLANFSALPGKPVRQLRVTDFA